MTCPRCGSPVRADITTLRDFNGARVNWRCTVGHSFWEHTGAEVAEEERVVVKEEHAPAPTCKRCGGRIERTRAAGCSYCLPCGRLRDMELRRERDARKRLVAV